MQGLLFRSGNGVILAQRARALLAPWVFEETTLAAILPVPGPAPCADQPPQHAMARRSPQPISSSGAPAVPGHECAAGEEAAQVQGQRRAGARIGAGRENLGLRGALQRRAGGDEALPVRHQAGPRANAGTSTGSAITAAS